MNRLIMAVATGCYVGLLPKAPGTWGSLLTVALSEGLFAVAGLSGVAALAAGSSSTRTLLSGMRV